MPEHDNQYHLSVKSIGRAGGRSAIAAAAYRSGALLEDQRTGETFDYSRRHGVVFSEIVVPPACAWAQDRATLWNRLEARTRANGRVSSEAVLALPTRLSDAQRVELVRQFVAEIVTRHGVAADVNIHAPHPRHHQDAADLPGDDPRNFHAHIMFSHLPVTPEGPGKKVSSAFDGADQIKRVRELWGEHVNRAYERAGLDLRQDHRSYREMGRDQEPTRHIGVAALALERRGIRTERGDQHRARTERRRAGKAVAAFQREETRRGRSQEPAGARPGPERKPLTEEQRQHRAAGYKARLLRSQFGPLDDLPRLATQIRRLDLNAEDGPRVFLNDGCSIRDEGERLTVAGAWEGRGRGRSAPTDTAIATMIALARAKGWESVELTGSPAFKAAACRAALAAGLHVTNPELRHIVESYSRQRAAADSQAEQPAPPRPPAASAADEATMTAHAAAAAQDRGDVRTVRTIFDTCPPALRGRVGDLLDQRAATLTERAQPDEPLEQRMTRSRAVALSAAWADMQQRTEQPEKTEPARVADDPRTTLRTLAERTAALQREAAQDRADPLDLLRAEGELIRTAGRSTPEQREAALHACRHDLATRRTLEQAIAVAEDRAAGTAGMSHEQRAARRLTDQQQRQDAPQAPPGQDTALQPEPPKPLPPWLQPPDGSGRR